MSKRRKNQSREALDAKREALTRAANQPKPEQEPEPAPLPRRRAPLGPMRPRAAAKGGPWALAGTG
jgi:hypothetical protein